MTRREAHGAYVVLACADPEGPRPQAGQFYTLVVNVMGFTRDQVAQLVEAFAERPEVAALELKVSCPNVETGLIMGADPAETAALLHRVRPLTSKPLVVKLTPNATGPAQVAGAAVGAGANAISLIDTLRGMALHPLSGGPWLGGRTGGVSGPAAHVALAQVYEVAERLSVPLVALGGVQSGRDALDFRRAGARSSRSARRASGTRSPARAWHVNWPSWIPGPSHRTPHRALL